MASLMLTALLFVPAFTAFAMLVAWRWPRAQSAMACAMSLMSLALSLWLLGTADGPLLLDVGGWQPPYGIGFRADGLSRLMLALTGTLFYMP